MVRAGQEAIALRAGRMRRNACPQFEVGSGEPDTGWREIDGGECDAEGV